jgi:NADH:ubiquinone oxidoreductase subunit 5 (subunit L)/multisubunit Na+/H+ antiporter MnhA subunit
MNRLGDMGLSIGFFAMFALFGSLNYATVFSISPAFCFGKTFCGLNLPNYGDTLKLIVQSKKFNQKYLSIFIFK